MKRSILTVLVLGSVFAFHSLTVLAGDGIPDSWRLKYFGPDFANDPRAAALADPDDDGANNYLEYITGTDPLNADSFDRAPVHVSTYAGSEQGWLDAFRTEALLNNPRDCAFDPHGRLWFTETTDVHNTGEPMSHRIRIISTEGGVTTLTGAAEPGLVDGPLAVARFNTPQSPIFDSHGNAYIGDLANNRVRKISDGIVSTFAGSTAGYRNGVGTNAQFYTVQNLCIDSSDNIYVADWDNICIRKVTPDGEVTLFAGQPGVRGRQDGPRLEATFETPGSMAFAPNGNMFVVDWANGLLRVIDTNGMVSTFADGLTYTHRVRVDAEANVYVTWGTPGPITSLRKYRPDGRIAWTVGGPDMVGLEDGPIERAKFAYAFSPSLLPNRNILITDQLNHRIRLIEMAGRKLIEIHGAATFVDATDITIATVATDAEVRYTSDGAEPTATSPLYSGPFTITATKTIKARLFVAGNPVSEIASATFTRSNPPDGPPYIVHQPASLTVQAGSGATFQVVATGAEPLSYQWQFNAAPLSDETNATLALANVQLSQAGDYWVIVANELGSATSSVATLTVVMPPTLIRVVSTSAASGGPVDLPVQIVARGQENALGFSLQFDPTRLSFVDVALSSSAPGEATLITNPNQANNGRVGVLVALPTGAAFPSGTQELVVVSFQAAFTPAPISVPVYFGDTPTLRQVSDTLARPVRAEYEAGSVNINRFVFEGDVAPRPGGDLHLSVIDWVQLGRFVAALDEVTAEEFQRADCAPRATLGNGVISVTDWVQAGRYAAGLDPITAAGGPVAPAAPTARVAAAPLTAGSTRVLSLPNINVSQAAQFTAPIWLEAEGNENAVGFSLLFDAAKIAFVSAGKGSSASNALLNVNSNQSASGTLGIALALPTGSSFASGSQQIVLLTFSTLANSPGTSPVSFANAPVLREVSDAQANALPCNYSDATITFSGVTAGPPLSLSRSGSNLVLYWTASESGFELERADSLGAPWTKVGITPISIGGQDIVSLPMNGAGGYFRLSKP